MRMGMGATWAHDGNDARIGDGEGGEEVESGVWGVEVLVGPDFEIGGEESADVAGADEGDAAGSGDIGKIRGGEGPEDGLHGDESGDGDGKSQDSDAWAGGGEDEA